jgi:glutamate 5-kinase
MAGSSKRIVIKLGSGILANPKGTALEANQFKRLAREVAALVASGREIILVSSGAVAAGLGAFGLKERADDLATKQACAAIGQSKLMQMYGRMFEEHGTRRRATAAHLSRSRQPRQLRQRAKHNSPPARTAARHSDHQRERLRGCR